jgi:hypothetical protein
MKALKPILIICATICCLVSCKKEVDMTLKQKTLFENADIRDIEVVDAWPVQVVYDSVNTFVEVEYSAYLENYLKINMDGGKLHVGFTGKVYAESGSIFKATVHTSAIENIEVNNAATLAFEGSFTGDRLKVTLDDASVCNGLVFSGEESEIKMEAASLMTGFQFVGENCTATLEDASQFNGEIQASESITIYLCDGSRFVNKGGLTQQANLHLTDASLLNMAETQVNTMEVELSGAAEATVHVTDRISGILTEASTLYYKGHPQLEVDCSDGSQLIPF